VSAFSRANFFRKRFGGAIATIAIVSICAGPAFAQALSFAPAFRFDPPLPQYAPQQQEDEAGSEQLPAQLRRQMVAYPTNEAPGTVIIDTAHTFLYLTLGQGMAMRYGIGVGRQGFTWSGTESIVRKAEWPDWIPPAQMVARQPYLPRWVGGGPGNPLGARALYLGNVQTLVVAEGFHIPGVECTSCGLLERLPLERCEACGGAMEPTHDVIHRAMARVIAQSGVVEVVHDGAAQPLADYDGLGAIFRFANPLGPGSLPRS